MGFIPGNSPPLNIAPFNGAAFNSGPFRGALAQGSSANDAINPNNIDVLLFAFCGDKLLVKVEGQSASVPYAREISLMGLVPLRTQFLGLLDGIPCFSAELAPDAQAPAGLTSMGLRQLFGLLNEELFSIAGLAFQVMDWDRTHLYCSCCGAKITNDPAERAKVCKACGHRSYPRISPAVIVAVVRENKLLLAQAKRFPTKLYSVIAGFVEPGETLEDCIRREVKEETGIEVKELKYFGSQPWPFPHSLMIAFTASYAGGEICINTDEIIDAQWFSAENLPAIPDKISIARRLIDWFVEKEKNADKINS